jgi:hypothetical protein
MLTTFERGLIANLVADWVLQNDWMARNKASLRHPAAWVHGGIHALLLGLALGWEAGLILALVHVLVDTRKPAAWWQAFFRQTSQGEVGLIVKTGLDQVLHITAIALWVALV